MLSSSFGTVAHTAKWFVANRLTERLETLTTIPHLSANTEASASTVTRSPMNSNSTCPDGRVSAFVVSVKQDSPCFS